MLKKDKPLVSIIVPVYNTEKYIGRAIDSILSQTYSNIEVILVNDGSTDKSGVICDYYASKDRRIIVFHKHNEGVASARNLGIEYSKGEYIQFVDSDDTIDSQMTEKLLSEYLNGDYDLVVCGLEITGRINTKVTYEEKNYSRNELLLLYHINKEVNPLIRSSCNMMFTMKIINRYCFRFDTNYRVGEDGLFTLNYCLKCTNIKVLKRDLYKYYTYSPNERISADYKFPIDLYNLRIDYFKKLYYSLEEELSTFEKNKLMHRFFDRVIADLVKASAYSEYFTRKEFYTRVRNILDEAIIEQSSKIYRRQQPEDSILIPILIKLKCIRLLILILKMKGNKFASKHGKSELVQSIYRINNEASDVF